MLVVFANARGARSENNLLKSEQRGFSLVELLLVLALVGLVLAIGWNLFSLVMKAWDDYQTRQEAEAAVRLTSMMITHELDYASFLEIREGNMWTTSGENKPNVGDRFIYASDAGDEIFLAEFTDSSSFASQTIVKTEKCTLELSFQKPDNPAGSHNYIDNILEYTITARYKYRDIIDENGNVLPEKPVIYTTSSSIMLGNMSEGYGVPGGDKSLYSEAKAYSPGDRIRYNTSTDRFVPGTPGTPGSCGF